MSIGDIELDFDLEIAVVVDFAQVEREGSFFFSTFNFHVAPALATAQKSKGNTRFARAKAFIILIQFVAIDFIGVVNFGGFFIRLIGVEAKRHVQHENI